MDRLEESLKRIVQVACDREFAFRILETIFEMKEWLKAGLLDLQRWEFIYRKSLFRNSNIFSGMLSLGK